MHTMLSRITSLEVNPVNFSALMKQGYAALSAGRRLKEAKFCFEHCLDLQPGDPSALIGWGIVQRGLGDPFSAMKALQLALTQTPDFPDAWAQLGTTLRTLNELKASGKALEHALTLAPDHAYASANLELLHNLYQRDECVALDYRPCPKPRYGYGQPYHDQLGKQLSQNITTYQDYTQSLSEISEYLIEISNECEPDRPEQPYWNNTWLPPLDASMLCTMIARHKPAKIVEIGSGMSTRFARWSIERFATGTCLESIDPEPRSEIDSLCDHVTRCKLEETNLQVFSDLQAGDIVFFDGSHRSFQNSDVTVFFLEILPSLTSGVIVHIHDIFLPYDYPPNWQGRLYNEQYLLASMLLAGQTRYKILWPSAFVADLLSLGAVSHLVSEGNLNDRGGSFWMQVR